MAPSSFATEHFTFSPVAETDVPILAKWLADPKLLEFYWGRDNPYDEESVRRSLLEADVENFIVHHDDEAIGYVQFYLVHPRWWSRYGIDRDEADYAFGMDQFIGDPTLWGQGLGSLFVGEVARYLVGSRGARRIFVDPIVTNGRAIRAYEKAGIRRVKVIPQKELHEGKLQDAWLMEFRYIHSLDGRW